MATEKKSFLLRIDPELWAALEKLAATELRSVNSQIEYLLRDAAVKRGALGGQSGVKSSDKNSGKVAGSAGTDTRVSKKD